MRRRKCDAIGHGAAAEIVRLLRAAPRVIPTTSYGVTDAMYQSGYWVDKWREEWVDNPRCRGIHRTAAAAIHCGERFARSISVPTIRLEDAEYV